MLHHLTQITCKEYRPVIGSGRLVTFLNNGETFADVHILGTVPLSRDLSKSNVNMGASSSLSSCNTTGLILSGPAAFFGLRFFSKCNIPVSEILISGMTCVAFVQSPGRWSGSMTLSSTRSWTFIRESSFNESEERGVNTDWKWSFNIFAFSFVSVWRQSFLDNRGLPCRSVLEFFSETGIVSYCPLDRYLSCHLCLNLTVLQGKLHDCP